MRRALKAEGLSEAEINRRVLCLDSKGLILADRPGISGHKKDIAADPAVVAGWTSSLGGRFALSDVVTQFKPTILVGVSGQPGAFTEDIIKTMHKNVVRPIVLTLSNPTSKVEARPEQLLEWTNGAAIIGTGSPFAPVTYNGVVHHIGQCNNAFVVPGIGLGAIVVRARTVPDEAFAAAAQALYRCTGSSNTPGASLFPTISELRAVSKKVALAVASALVECGAAPPMAAVDIESRVVEAIWEPRYLPYRPV